MKAKKRSSPENYPEQPDVHWIDDLKIARYLLEPQHQMKLEPFMCAEVTVTQVAQELGLEFRKTYSLVKRLERYGLIRTVRLEQRDGRPIQLYRASAKHFFVPISLVPIEQVMQIVNGQFEQVFAEQIARATWGELNPDCGIQVWHSARGINCMMVQAPNQFLKPLSLEFPATYSMWDVWSLDFEEAKALQQELFALSEKYSRRKNGSQKYLVRFAMTPVQSE
jgi:predicted transcriptional regulator